MVAAASENSTTDKTAAPAATTAAPRAATAASRAATVDATAPRSAAAPGSAASASASSAAGASNSPGARKLVNAAASTSNSPGATCSRILRRHRNVVARGRETAQLCRHSNQPALGECVFHSAVHAASLVSGIKAFGLSAWQVHRPLAVPLGWAWDLYKSASRWRHGHVSASIHGWHGSCFGTAVGTAVAESDDFLDQLRGFAAAQRASRRWRQCQVTEAHQE